MTFHTVFTCGLRSSSEPHYSYSGGRAVKLILALIAFPLISAAQAGPANAVVDVGQRSGQVVVVQAVPGVSVNIAIDGKPLKRQAGVGSMTRSAALAPGTHDVAFSSTPGGRPLITRISVVAGSSTDVVLHLPASVDGAPVVSTYATPRKPIGPGKARLLLAHTATVAPADVQFDGKIVFTNIANGEFADADVPAGSHRAALLPTGTTENPILGPLTVDLAPETATMIYAVGNPGTGSMDVIAHTVALSSDGSTVPRSVDTGSAGLAGQVEVTPFGSLPQTDAHSLRSATADPSLGSGRIVWFAGGLGLLLLSALGHRARRNRRSAHSPSRPGIGLPARVK